MFVFGAPSVDSAAVEVPAPVFEFLPSFKSFTSVQLEPFHNSVIAKLLPGDPSPPKATLAVYVPAEPKLFLPTFKSLTSVQLEPLKISVYPV